MKDNKPTNLGISLSDEIILDRGQATEKDFTTRLLESLSTTPISSFSPLEKRLIEIMSELVPRFLTYIWLEGYDISQGPLTKPPELTEKVVMKTIRLSLIGAIEADEQLRQLRK